MITEKKHENRLDNYDINIKTKYKTEGVIKERNTDNSKNDNVIEGIRLEKSYYYKGKVIKKENVFDSRILYTYIFDSKNKKIKCANCGRESIINEEIDRCPYCHSSYNIEFDDKNLGSKYYYDLTMKNNNYIIKTLIIDIIFSFIITLIFVKNTSRTFYFFDISKVIVGTILVSGLLFYIFYYLDAAIILPGIKKYKEKINNQQKHFWINAEKLGINKTSFYNNINYCFNNLYYSDKYPEIIDYDIIDFNDFKLEEKSNNELYITVNLDIRIAKINKNNKFKSKILNKKYKFKRVKTLGSLKGGENLIKCPNCGASIDVTKGKCEYCQTETNYLQEWYLIEEK